VLAPIVLMLDAFEVQERPRGAGLLEHREPADRIEVDADAALPAVALDRVDGHPLAAVVRIALLAMEEAEHVAIAGIVGARRTADDAGAGLALQAVQKPGEVVEVLDRKAL
jgi:hypothetical protein